MRKLDYNEYFICKTMATIFEESIELSNFSSSIFIQRFMTCDETKCFFNKTYICMSCNKEQIIYDLNEKYKKMDNKVNYSKNEMYWIGYIYGALAFLYNLSSKSVFKLFPSKEIVKYYFIYHTFDIEEAAERMMETIKYPGNDYNIRGKEILGRLEFK